MPFSRICVFCGARKGDSDAFAQAAQQLGREFLKNKIELVYGGKIVSRK